MEPSEQTGPDSGSQEVNPVYLQQLRELDIPEEAAKQVKQVKKLHRVLSHTLLGCPNKGPPT